MDETELRRFVHSEYPRLVASVAMILDSRAAAEDAVQEALVRAWERVRRGESIESLGAWVTTVSLNLARSRLRRLRSELKARGRLRAQASVSGSPLSPADRLDLRRALAALPRRQREATVLRYYLGLDVAEIAEAMGAPVGTAKSWLARARVALADALGEADLEEVTERDQAR